MVVETTVTLIKDIGFPIFVAVFVLVNQSKQLKELTGVLHDIKEVMMLCHGNGGAAKLRIKRREKS